jgi:GTPase SAR1 family protein
MRVEALCTLFVLGDRGAGKSSLIRSLLRTSKMYKGDETKGLELTDWIISFNKERVYVEIKEFSEIKNILSIKETIRKNENVILNIVINISRRNFSEERDVHWLEYIKKFTISPKIIVIVTLNTFNTSLPQKIKTDLKERYPFVRYWLHTPIFFRDDSILGHPYFIRQIIINKFTDSLEYAKELIRRNVKEKSKYLDLGMCCLTSLLEVEEVFKCTHIESLIISNEWGKFENGEWQREQSNNRIGPNVFTDIPKEIQKLKNLRTFICGGDWKSKRKTNITQWHISDISVLSALTELRILNVSNNKIQEVGDIQKLIHLSHLFLNNNSITQFPSIANLRSIVEINISNNLLSSVAFLKNNKSIKTIDIHSNKIKDLSTIRDLIERLDIKDSKWETGTISVLNNPLENPKPSVIRGGKKDVIAYFNQTEAESKINLKPFRNRDIKLILVGNSNAGKSTLTKWLKTNKFDKTISTTHWMVVETWNAKQRGSNYNVRIFDFGGQEYYHDTHHLFFTNRTAYVILWEEKTNQFGEIGIEQMQLDKIKRPISIQTFPLEYWLESISFHINKRIVTKSEKNIERIQDERDAAIEDSVKIEGDFDRPVYESISKFSEIVISLDNDKNILIVQNKVDSQTYKKFINEADLKSEYQKIYDFTSISVAKKRGLEGIRSQLFEIFDSLDIVNQNYLGTWGFIKEKIETTRFLKPYTLTEFKSLCNRTIRKIPTVLGKTNSQINDVLFTEQDTRIFAEFLADIGLILYYPQDSKLSNKIFLNQKRILEKVYLILLGINKESGEFDKSTIAKTLKVKKIPEEVNDILNLMIHFKIIFEHPTKPNAFIAPLYLPKEAPKSITIFISLFEKPLYRYRYQTYIHKSVILDFFHLYGKQVFKESKNDSLFYYWRNGIVLKDEISGEIVLVKFFPGNDQGQNAYIDVFPIKNAIEGEFLKKVIADLDKINEGLNAKKCVTSNGKDFVPLEEIHKNEKEDNWIFLSDYDKKYYKLSDFKKHLNTSSKMKKIFISYSKLDLKYVTKFLEHLSALQLDGKVSHWFCSELEAGSEWDKEIQEHFDKADIVCFMLSPNFMKTTYIHEHEVAKAFAKKQKDPNFKIVPIILDFCKWTTSKNNLGDFTALPYTAKPIADFLNENMAWYIIQECLRIMIDKNLDPKGYDFYEKNILPPDVLSIYKRIVDGKVDKNAQ